MREIVHLKAVRDEFKLFYKTHYNNDFEVLDFLKVSAMKKSGTGMSNPKPLEKPAGFSNLKKQAILEKLKGVIPDNRKRFWIDLPSM